MKIGICAKITPDTDTRIKVQGDGIDPTGVKWVVSPYDLFGVEEAIRTKEALSDSVEEVIGYSVGPSSILTQLRQSCLALGADRAVIVSGESAESTDSLGVAKCLAKAIARDDVSLVFCGKVALDDDNTQVPAMIAALLDWELLSRVSAFETDGSSFTATRNLDGGVEEVVTGNLPVVVTADRGLNTPRYAKLPAIMKAKRKPVDQLSPGDLGLSDEDLAAQVRATAWSLPEERPSGRILEGDLSTQVKELVRLLREEAKVI